LKNRIRFLLFSSSLGLILAANPVFADASYHFFADLTTVQNDRLEVSLTPPDFTTDEVIYRLPAIVPGTYAVYDFGRFVSDFTVLDKEGKALETERLDINSWKIRKAKTIGKITYRVEDTWHTKITDNFVFEPGGTNIEKDKNFVINTHGFFGYFDGYKLNPFQLEFRKPRKFYGSTSLVSDQNTATGETYTVSDYMRLVDSPIMFCVPDTTTLSIGGARILISVYSAKKTDNAGRIAATISTILNAQKDYLGGKLPIAKYAFIIDILSEAPRSGAYGALEHSYSSFYVFPEMDASELASQVRDFAAHEFFHIITPLSIHSEEIGNFDYNVPKMSAHLWMYEGLTEYCAGHVQVVSGLINLEGYADVLHKKIEAAAAFNDTLPFTEMSLGCLKKYKDQYDNVYQKGALIGLCLDIELRTCSKGSYGLQNLMKDLSKVYGKDKSFKDNELFSEITRLTYPEIGVFLTTYVSGNKPLPLAEELKRIGITFKDSVMKQLISPLGGINPAYDMETGKFYIHPDSYKNANAFGKSIGLKVGDDLIKINGKKLEIKTVEKVLEEYVDHAKEGSVLKLNIVRKDENGKPHKMKLSVKLVPVELAVKDVLTVETNISPEQARLRKAWLEEK